MSSSGKDGSSKQSAGNVQGKANIYEDEVSLTDYFLVLWKRKWFIFLGAVLPAFIVGITLFLLPRNYKETYVYDLRAANDYDVRAANDLGGWDLDEKNYEMLLNRFYSKENLDKLIEKYVKLVSNSNEQSGKLVEFEVVPPFLNIPKLNITDPERLNKIRSMKALLLKVTITCESREDIHKISSVIRDNIENVLPLYIAREQLSAYIKGYNSNLADIEHNRFSLGLALNDINEILAGLKKINAGIQNEKLDNIVLQFNVGEQSQYLPLSYQIQAAESKKIGLEGNIKANEETYKYYKDLLNLNNKIFAELNGKLSSECTVDQFKLFLTGLVDIYEKPELKDRLNSYIRMIENRILANKPITEKPQIYPIAKGTVKKSGIVFVIALILSVFTAFLWEGFEKKEIVFYKKAHIQPEDIIKRKTA
jgi:hypothetical protein